MIAFEYIPYAHIMQQNTQQISLFLFPIPYHIIIIIHSLQKTNKMHMHKECPTKQKDPILQKYLVSLQQQKFKAKILYTLTCIRNYLESLTPSLQYDRLLQLQDNHGMFVDIARQYGDMGVYELLVAMCGVQGKGGEGEHGRQAMELLRVIEDGVKAGTGGGVPDGLVDGLCRIMVQCRWNGKGLVMMLLQKGNDQIKTISQKKLIRYLINNCQINLQQCIKICQISNRPHDEILPLMLSVILKTKMTQNNKQIIYKFLTRELEKNWRNEKLVYYYLCISLACSITQNGTLSPLCPKFLNTFLHNQIKPMYPTHSQTPNKLPFPQQFPSILSHYVLQYSYLYEPPFPSTLSTSNLLSTLQEILPQLRNNTKQYVILEQILQGDGIGWDKDKEKMEALGIEYADGVGKGNGLGFLKFLEGKYGQIGIEQQRNVRKFFVGLKALWGYWIGKKGKQIGAEEAEILMRLCLGVLQVFILHKDLKYLKFSQKLVKAIIVSLYSSHEKIYLKLLSADLNYAIFWPFIIDYFPEQKTKKQQANIIKKIDLLMNNEKIGIKNKFYLTCCLLVGNKRNVYKNQIAKFLYFLLRTLTKQKEPYEQIAYYLKNYEWSNEVITWIEGNFDQQIQRVLEKIFGMLPYGDFKTPKLIIFALQKYQIFRQWDPVFRWSLNPLDDPKIQSSEQLVDSLEVFETLVEDCKKVPLQIIKKFFQVVANNWNTYTHHHMFTIERISRSLFSEQDLSSQNLQELSWFLKNLTKRQWPNAANPQLYKQSLSIMISNTLMQQTEELDTTLTKLIYNEILSIPTSNLSSLSLMALKTKLFSQQLLMWRLQYQQTALLSQISQTLFSILSPQCIQSSLGSTPITPLIQNTLQIISTVSHNSNLLSLSLSQLLELYPSNSQIILYISEILGSVNEINEKAIVKFRLEKVLLHFMGRLIVESKDGLWEGYAGILGIGVNGDTEGTRGEDGNQGPKAVKGSKGVYWGIGEQNTDVLAEIVRGQALFLGDGTREPVVKFALEKLKGKGKLNKKLLQIIWFKYFYDNDIKQICQQMAPELKILAQCLKFQNLMFINQKQQTKLKQTSQGNKPIIQSKQQKQIKEQANKNQNSKQSIKIQQEKELKKQNQVTQQIQINPVSQQANQPKRPIKKKPGFSLQISAQKAQKAPAFEAPKPTKSQKQNPFSFSSFSSSSPKNTKDPDSSPSPSPKKKRQPRNLLSSQQTTHMNTIKGHISFLSSLSQKQTNQSQIVSLQESLTYLTDVICLHAYYCQKTINLGVVGKCLALGPKTGEKVRGKILELFGAIGENREKNSGVFGDQKVIEYFKTVLKEAINSRKQGQNDGEIIGIVENCWNNANQFFNFGLLSMLFQMAKMDLNRIQILEMLTKNQLSLNVINQIYQRGLFNVMQITLQINNKLLTQKDKDQICLWAKLIGKVCLNQSIRQKMFSMKLHTLTHEKLFVFNQKQCLQNYAFLLASFVYEYEKIASWCIQQKIPQIFLAHIQKYKQTIPTQFYKFFRYFSQNGNQFVEHLFRIKFHVHMQKILPITKKMLKNQGNKHFFKCLSNLFGSQHYEIFLKSRIIQILVQNFEQNHNSYSLECLQKLICEFKDKKQVQQLQKQNFYKTENVFNSKVKDDQSYPYILNIYISLLKKFKKFDNKYLTLTLVNKVIRKGIYSINMEGKKKVIEFLIQLSEVDKVCYGNGNCLRIFENIFGYSIKEDQIDLLIDYLRVEAKYQLPVRPNDKQRVQQQQKHPLRFKKMTKIPCQPILQPLISHIVQLSQSPNRPPLGSNPLPSKMILIFNLLYCDLQNILLILNKLATVLLRNSNIVFKFQDSITLVMRLLLWKELHGQFKQYGDLALGYIQAMLGWMDGEIGKGQELKKETIQYFCDVAEKFLKSSIIPQNAMIKFANQKLQKSKVKDEQCIKRLIKLCSEYKNYQQITPTIKYKMRQGVKVKMYKQDGSNSSLIMYFTEDLIQLHCTIMIGDPVKNKWKMGLNQIFTIQQYDNQNRYKNSVFYLSEGLFTSAPPKENCLSLNGKSKSFHICFQNTSQLQEWKKYIQLAKNRALQILLKLS